VSRVVLIQPRYGLSDEVQSRPSAPLGLLKAASLVDPAHEIVLLDARLERDIEARVCREIDDDVVCVGLTVISGECTAQAVALSNLIKKRFPKVTVVWGGKLPTMFPEIVGRHPSVDILVRGDGEVVFAELVETLSNGGDLSKVRGISYRRHGIMTHNDAAPPVDLAALPPLRYDLIDIADHTTIFGGRRSFNYESSRGCPVGCTFCYNTQEPSYRAYPAERVIDDVKRLVRDHGIEQIWFVDDNLCRDHDRLLAIAEGITPLGLTWDTQGAVLDDINALDDRALDVMAESGCVRLMMGVQTAVPRIARLMRSSATPETALTVNRRLMARGIRPHYYIMLGFPDETDDERRQTIDLALRLTKENPEATTSPFFCYEPWPGTPLFRYVAKRHGLREPEDVSFWMEADWEEPRTPWVKPDEKRYLEKAHFLSIFYDRKYSWYSGSRFVQTVCAVYRPVARWRLRRDQFGLLVEQNAFEMIAKLTNLKARA
jgi:radical SAM superfamily enzyme YgiQ (UPF0313 family)